MGNTKRNIDISLKISGDASKVKNLTAVFDKIYVAVEKTKSSLNELQASLNKIKPPASFNNVVSSLEKLAKLKIPNVNNFATGLSKLNDIKTPPDLSRFVDSLKDISKLKVPGVNNLAIGLQKLVDPKKLNLSGFAMRIGSIEKQLNRLSKINLVTLNSVLTNLSNVNLNRASKSVQDFEARLNKSAATAQKATYNFRSFGEKVRTVLDFRAISEGILLLKQGIQTGISAIVEYDQALKDLQAITGATALEVGQMGEKILDVASKTKFSASEVAEGMRTLGQAGFTAAEAIGTMQAVSDLATGTLSNMANTVDLFTTVMRVFNVEASQSASVSDVFANAINKSKLTVDKLRTSMQYVGPVAKEANITFEELSASMMVLANAGLRSSKIGTGLRRIFAELVDPSEKLQTAVHNAGISLSDLDPQTNSLSDVLLNLSLVLTDAQVAFDLFGKRGAAAVLALTTQKNNFDAMLTSVQKSGTAASMAAKQMEGLGVSWKNLQDKMKNFAIALGNAGISDVLRILINLGRVLADVFTGVLNNAFVSFSLKIGIVTASLGLFSLGLVRLGIILKTKVITTFVAAAVKLFGFATALNAAGASAGAVALNIGTLNTAIIATTASVRALWVSLGLISLAFAALSGLGFFFYKLATGAKEASEEAVKLADTYSQLGAKLTSYSLKVVNLDKTTDEYKNANKDLRASLLETARSVKEVSIVALAAAESIDPVTGEIIGNGEALEKYNEQLQALEFHQIEVAAQKAEQALRQSTNLLYRSWSRFINKIKDENIFAILGGKSKGLKALNKDVEDFALAVNKKTLSLKQMQDKLESWRGQEFTKQMDKMQSHVVALTMRTDALYSSLIKQNKISLNSTAEQVRAVGTQAKYSEFMIQALVDKLHSVQEAAGKGTSNVIEKWAKADPFSEQIKQYNDFVSVTVSNEAKMTSVITEAQKKNAFAYQSAMDAIVEKNKKIKDEYLKNISVLNLSDKDREKLIKQHLNDQVRLHQESGVLIRKMNTDASLKQTKLLIQAGNQQQDALAVLEERKRLSQISQIQFDEKRVALTIAFQEKINKIKLNYIAPDKLIDRAKIEIKIKKEQHTQELVNLEESLRKKELTEKTYKQKQIVRAQQLAQETADIWEKAYRQMKLQGVKEDSKSFQIILKNHLTAQAALNKVILSGEKKNIKITIAEQTRLYEKANKKREVDHANFILKMVEKETAAGTSIEKIEKLKAKATFDLYKDRLYAAASHFGQIRDIYAEDSAEYIKRQTEYKNKHKEFLEQKLQLTETYAKLEYEANKAKISAILALNDALYTSDSKVQQARINAAESTLNMMYKSQLITLENYHKEKQILALKDSNEDISLLIKKREATKKAYNELIELEKSGIAQTQAKSQLNEKLLDLTAKINVLNEQQTQTLDDLALAREKDIESSDKRIKAMIDQFKSLKEASDISLADDPTTLKEKHALEVQQLKDKIKVKLDLIADEVNVRKDAEDELDLAQQIAAQLMANLEKKHAKEILDTKLLFQDKEYANRKELEDAAHIKRMSNITRQAEDENWTAQKITKTKLDAEVLFREKAMKLANMHLLKVDKADIDNYNKRLQIKTNADKAYYDALMDRIIGIAEVEHSLEDAKLTSGETTSKSIFDLNVSKQIQEMKTLHAQAKSEYTKGNLSTKQYYDKQRELADKNVKDQLENLKIRQKIVEAEIALRIAATDDESEKIKLHGDLEKAKNAVLDAENKIQEGRKQALAKLEADENKEIERKQDKVNALIEAAHKAADSMFAKDSTSTLRERLDNELAEFDRAAKAKLQLMRDNEAEIAEIEELANFQRLERKSLVDQQEKQMDEQALARKQSVVSGMANLSKSMYDAGLISSKKGFNAMKAFAIAEAIINMHKAATEAYSEGGPYLGPILAAIAIAQNMVQIAAIRAQKPAYASGGKISGNSPTPTSDNIDIRATAGEYIHPVKSVQYYGEDVMEGLRRRIIPKSFFSGLTNLPKFPKMAPKYAFATGGSVTQESARVPVGSQKQPINIVNTINPGTMISSGLNTPEGKNAFINNMAEMSETIKKVLF